MALVKPFVRYSRLYRLTKDSNVKRIIYANWYREIAHLTSLTAPVLLAKCAAGQCGFCYSVANEFNCTFCKNCLFPINHVDRTNDELFTYCMLSVCYFETFCASVSHRTVYKQRLKMTWYEYECANKTYATTHPKCYQCKRKNSNVTAAYTYFNDKMFCNTCLFPLFDIKKDVCYMCGFIKVCFHKTFLCRKH